MDKKTWYIIEDDFESHSVHNSDGVKLAEGIPFASCAQNLVHQLETGMIEEEMLSCYSISGE